MPQGTVSGPCLYNLGTNKIEICANLGTLTSFADDNTPVVPGISGVDGGSVVVRCLASQFAERNLSLNYAKLKELRFNFRSTGVSIPEIDNIEAAQELDILGFRLDLHSQNLLTKLFGGKIPLCICFCALSEWATVSQTFKFFLTLMSIVY